MTIIGNEPQIITAPDGEYIGFIDARAHDLTFILNGHLEVLAGMSDNDCVSVSDSPTWKERSAVGVRRLRGMMSEAGSGNIYTNYEEYSDTQRRFRTEPLPNPKPQD